MTRQMRRKNGGKRLVPKPPKVPKDLAMMICGDRSLFPPSFFSSSDEPTSMDIFSCRTDIHISSSPKNIYPQSEISNKPLRKSNTLTNITDSEPRGPSHFPFLLPTSCAPAHPSTPILHSHFAPASRRPLTSYPFLTVPPRPATLPPPFPCSLHHGAGDAVTGSPRRREVIRADADEGGETAFSSYHRLLSSPSFPTLSLFST